MPATDPVRVLLIVGSGRSGSTLFERALGGVPGVAALGEVVHLWDRAVRDDELCACGEHFSRCPFWGPVGADAFGGWDTVAVDDAVRRRHEVVRTRRLPGLLLGRPSASWRADRDQLARDLEQVLRAAAGRSGARLVVDSSKMPAYAALLMRTDLDVRCVHVVRDPRGVAHSMAKQVVRPEAADADLMHRTRPAESALWWSAFDLISGGVLPVVGRAPFLTVRYEDFARDPRASLRTVLDFAGLAPDASDLAHLDGDLVQLGPNHQVAGNPMRFRTGEVAVRRDEEWRDSLAPRDRRTVGLLTAGLRHRYGYR